jgi:epoxyqueuosine reductase QueG
MTLNSEIESKLVEQGACLVGFADIGDLRTGLPDSMTSALSIAARLDASIISEIADGPTEQYYQEYRRVNEFLAHLSETTVEYLKGRGNRAAAIKPTVEGRDLDYGTLTTSLPHKTVATRAGLGWIGKSALLVTKEFGPAVRLATVLTDAEFEVGKAISSSRCGDCEKCVVHCPAKAISGRNWKLGLEREAIYDAFACCDTARKLAKRISLPSTLVICGICINVCPWTQKYISRELAP